MKKIISYIAISIILFGLIIPVFPQYAIAFSDSGSANSDKPTLREVTTQAAVNAILPGVGGIDAIKATAGTWLMEIISRASYILLGLMSLLLYLAGTILNFVLNYTVVNMSQNVAGMTGINTAWKVIRDLMNIAFIFLLVWEGIKMILGLSKDNAKSLITGIIISSLLINFSLFFTKVIIDASNIVTVGFYNQIIDGSDVAVAGTSSVSGLSVPFMRALGVSDFYSGAVFDSAFSDSAGGPKNLMIIGLAGSILFLIIAFVFLAVAIMFIVRYIILLILLMTSPIAYMRWALPFTKKYSDEWWESLKGQALFAPIYMIMTWVIITLMYSPNFIMTPGSPSWSKMLVAGKNGTADAGSISLLFNFAVIIGLVIASLIIAKKTASQGSNLIGKAMGVATVAAGGAIMGGTAALARNTIGARANSMANNEELKARAAKGDRVAKMQLATSGYIAGSSFDTRKTLKSAGVSLDTGKVKEGGYKKKVEEKAKKEEEYVKSLKVSDQEKEKARMELTDESFEAEEAKRKEAFHSSPVYLKNIENQKKPHEDAKVAATTEKTEVEKQKTKIDTDIAESDKRIKDLEEKIKNSTDAVDQSLFEEQLKREKTTKQSLLDNLKDTKDAIKQKVKVIEDSEKEITRIQEEAEEKRRLWMSDKKKELVAQSGGQAEVKKDGKIIQEKIEDASIETNRARTEAYAQTLTEKVRKSEDSVLWRMWHGNPQLNRAAAAKVRASNKKKSAEQLFKEAVEASGGTPPAAPPAGGTPPPSSGAPTP